MTSVSWYVRSSSPADIDPNGMDRPEKSVDAARDWALRCLCDFESRGNPIDRQLSRLMSSNLPPRDRRFVRQLVLGTLRWQLRIDWVVDQFARRPIATSSVQLRQILRLGTYQILWLDGVPDHAAVNTSVQLARRCGQGGLSGAVNGILREVARRGAKMELPSAEDLAEHLSVRHSHPRWLVEKWLSQRGVPETEGMLAAQAEQAALFLRLNPLQGSESELRDMMSSEGRTLTPAGLLPGYFAVDPAEGLFSSPAYAAGRFQVQDVNAALPVALLDPRPGERILDLCGAPGGKTTQMAERMGDDGLIIAADRSLARLQLVRENVHRLGLRSIHLIAFDARIPGLGAVAVEPAESGYAFDRVLADVPCSGTGVLGRHPEYRWQKGAEQLPGLICVQESMLREAFALLRPGGVLVYCTCSLEPEENAQVVEQFLGETERAKVEPARELLPNSGATGAYVEMVPGKTPGDGVFAARIRKLP